jgi:3-methyladenine DNA glycosylase AlkC
MNTKQYISYKDDNEEVIRGYFEVIEDKPEYIKILSLEGNKIKIPTHRLLKQKEKSK